MATLAAAREEIDAALAAVASGHGSVATCIARVIAACDAHQAASVASVACRALCKLVADEAGRESAAAGGAVALVVGCLVSHGRSEPVVKAACATLAQMAASSLCCSAIVTAGGVPALVDALSSHTSSEAIAQASCQALQRIAGTADGSNTVVVAGGVASIRGVLAAHATSSATVDAACSALAAVAGSDRTCEAIAAAGTIPLVVSTARALAAHTSTVEAACCLLQRLAAVRECQHAIAEAGAIPTLINIMVTLGHAHPTTEIVCITLHSIAGEEENVTAMAAVDALMPLLVDVLAAPESPATAVTAACRLIAKLAVSPTASKAFVATGGIGHIIVAGLIVHSAVRATTAATVNALAALAEHDDDNRHSVCAALLLRDYVAAVVLRAPTTRLCAAARNALPLLCTLSPHWMPTGRPGVRRFDDKLPRFAHACANPDVLIEALGQQRLFHVAAAVAARARDRGDADEDFDRQMWEWMTRRFQETSSFDVSSESAEATAVARPLLSKPPASDV